MGNIVAIVSIILALFAAGVSHTSPGN